MEIAKSLLKLKVKTRVGDLESKLTTLWEDLKEE